MRFGRFGAMAASVVACTVATIVTGCAGPARPDPGEAFDELTRRSLGDDAAYVKAHLSPVFVAEEKAKGSNAESDEYLRGLMKDLQLCRALSWQKTDDPNRVTVEAARLQPGTVKQGKVDMLYERKSGWMLARPIYDLRPLESGASGK